MIKYEVTDNGYCAMPPYENYKVLELTGYEYKLVNRYKVLLAHKHDLERAEACLNQMLFKDDTSLIDNALMNSAVQLLVKCFSTTRNGGRYKLDPKKVFRTFAKEYDGCDLYELFEKFDNARNQVISHDEKSYMDSIVGITISDEGIACDVTEITVVSHYLSKKNQVLLLHLVNVAIEFCNEQINSLKSLLINKYNSTLEKPHLTPIDREKLHLTNDWNRW